MATAAALEAQGCEVGYVGLLDTHPVPAYQGPGGEEPWRDAALTVLAALRGKPFDAAELLQMGRELNDPKLDTCALFSDENRSFAAVCLERWTGLSLTTDAITQLQMQIDMTKNHLALLAGAEPETGNLPLHIYRPRPAASPEPMRDTFRDHSRQAPNSIRIDYVDGDHYSMLSPPHVQALACLIRTQLFEHRTPAFTTHT